MLGLAAGLASFVIILLYLNYELSYDSWSPEMKKVYRVSIQYHQDFLTNTPAPLASLLAQNYPNAEAATMLQSSGDFELLVAAGDKKIYQKNIVTVDSCFLKVFPYRLTEGNAVTALNQPNTAVIGQELSHKLFGDKNPVGKTLKLYNAAVYVVTGVLQSPSGPTHLPVEVLIRDPNGKQNTWGNFSYQTYIKLRHPETDAQIEDAINRVYYAGHLKTDNRSYTVYRNNPQATVLFVDAASKIYNFPKHGSSNFRIASVLLLLAVLLLVAGAINFSNLAIAQSMRRAKEVGVRKVLGSGRGQLVFQFMTETALQCLVSSGLAILAVGVVLSYINSSFNIHLTFWQQDGTLSLLLQIALCLVAVTILAGLYPSLFLSQFNTTKVLKGDYSSGTKGRLLRNGLIVIQFMVSVFFITAILVIRAQMHYMETKDKGFSGEQVMRIEATQQTRDAGFDVMQQTLLSLPGVSAVSKTTKVPGDHLFIDTNTISFKYAGKPFRMASVKVSKDYFRTLHIALLKGRGFTNETGDQHTRTAIINESAAGKLGLADPVGKVIYFPGCDSIPVQVIGVVRDFNESGFEMTIQPEVYTIGNNACMFQSGGAILVKIAGKQAGGSIAAIEQAWKKIEPDFPMRYTFLDENFQALFSSYARLQKIITFFGGVALVISITGLFALTAFFIRRRTKEIGIRKVMGASAAQLTSLLSREFIYLVGLAVIITTPVSWWCVQQWLQTFAYRAELSAWLFLGAGCLSLVVAVITIGFQSIRAATRNPVNSLRRE